jgi:DDE family transposase
MRSRKNNKRRRVLASRDVQKFTEECLQQHVPLVDSGPKCTAGVLWKVLLWAAARICSIAAVCRRWQNGLSDQTVYDALAAQLPKRPRVLEKKLNAALVHQLPRGVLKRARPVAIDYHEIPYHGEPLKHANELCHGKPKSGTTKFHAYATACIVEKGHRFTLAYTWVKRGEKQTAVIARLLERVRALGLKIKRLLVDRAFFNVATMAYLQEQRIPFLMPVVMRGRKPKRGKPAKGLRKFLKEDVGWYRHTMKSKGKEATFSVCVCYKTYLHHRTSKRCKKKLIYAAWRVHGAPVELREMYRKRFGIETSYRQRREARIRTCTRDPKLRLFYVGISLLLRNVWVLLHATLLAEGDDIHPEPCLEKLRYADLLEWLSDFIKTLLAVNIGFRIDCDTGKRVTIEDVT